MHTIPNPGGGGTDGGSLVVLDWWDRLFWRWQSFIRRLQRSA